MLAGAQKHESFGPFVIHAEALKSGRSFLGKCITFFNEVEVQVDFGLVEVAERTVVLVADGRAMAAGFPVEGQRTCVVAPQKMKIRDVVVDFRGQTAHALAFCDEPRLSVLRRGSFEIT